MSAPAWLKSFAGSAKKKPKLNCTAAASSVAVARADADADYMAEELLQVLCKTRERWTANAHVQWRALSQRVQADDVHRFCYFANIEVHILVMNVLPELNQLRTRHFKS